MIRGIYTAASGLGVLQTRMDATSNNLANISTNAFKQDRVLSSSFPNFMLQEKTRTGIAGRSFGSWAPIGRTNQGTVVSGVLTDYNAGVLKETGQETDLALSGEGFFAFEVQEENGSRVLYSRDGELHRDSEGYLVNSRGHRLLGENGPVQVSGGNFTVEATGVLLTSDNEETLLTILDFPEKSKLAKEGDSYYSALEGEGIAAENPGIKQGFLERSNVDLPIETVRMIEIVRAYEAGQKLLQAQDGLLDSAINRVGMVR